MKTLRSRAASVAVLAVAMAIALAGVHHVACDARRAAARHRKRAEAYLAQGDYDAAVKELTKAIDLSRDRAFRALCYTARGEAQVRRGNLGAAIQDYTGAIQLDPQNEGYYAARGSFHCRRGEYREGIEDYTRALELNAEPAVAEIYYDLRASACSLADDLDGAIRDYTKLQELRPNVAGYLNNRGWAYNRKGAYALAIADLDRAIAMSPRAHFYDSRAWAHFHLGNLAGAEADARKATSLDAGFVWHHALLFRVEMARGHPDLATEQARQFLSAGHAAPEATAVQLLHRYFLGEVPLEALHSHSEWQNYEVMARGYAVEAPQAQDATPARPPADGEGSER